MSGAPVKTVVIPSSIIAANRAQQAIMKEVAEHGFVDQTQFAVRLALDEALANAILHGNQNDEQKHITIDYCINDEQVQISIRDEGSGFDADSVPDPTRDENLEKPHGRGVMLMKAYMSEVHFTDCGTCVTLVKHRGCTLPRP